MSSLIALGGISCDAPRATLAAVQNRSWAGSESPGREGEQVNVMDEENDGDLESYRDKSRDA